ncbi:putative disease resistance protein RGA1, partial [Mucuna pruriens]
MAESFLFSIAESLITKLASRAFQEASQVLSVYHHLQDLTETLSLVKAVLLDAEQKQEQNHELREWLRQIKCVFSDAEDVLDEFECRTLRKQVIKAHGTTKDKVSHFFSSSNPVVFRYRMAQQIKDINNRLDKVAADRLKFGLQIINVDTRVVHRREMTHSRVRDSNVIGREHDKDKIIELLMQQNPNDDDISLSVIPIVGIGGLGKTTLAQFVFNDKRIHECFPKKMWVCVSDDFDIKQLIIKIINSANDFASADAPPPQQNLNMLEMEQLQNQLTNKLAGHKFLLVLDDVWNEDRVKWIELSNLIQAGAPGSKILVTTRNYSIASMMGTVPSHVLEGLFLEDSFSLFVKWAFKEGEEGKYPHLLNIGREIVTKCRGIPLAVRTLGSLLFQKFEANEWERVRDNEIWNLPQKTDDILPALKLSYDLMPSYLRQCFALFTLFPKDFLFDSLGVASLWWALGLLPSPAKNRTLEDVANQYLYELQSRSFLQDFVNYDNYYIFKIHDLVHDLALFVAKDECLLINSHYQNIPENVRHVSFAEKNLLGNSFSKKSVAVRTIVFPNGTAGAIAEAFLNTCVSKFKYLRVLDLKNSACETLPRSIGKLINLRYFDIAGNCNLKRLPDSICKLQNLQLLKFDGCKELEALPKGLRKLVSLRRLGITTKQSVLPYNEITKLNFLDALIIESSHNLESICGGVKFPALRTFIVSDCQSLKSLQLDFINFPELETLTIASCDNLDLELWKGHHKEQGPKLKLKTVHFVDLPQMETLPLWLQETANSLQCLTISSCYYLEMLPQWLSTLTNLKILDIKACPNFLSFPDNIHHLTALERLTIGENVSPMLESFGPKYHTSNKFSSKNQKNRRRRRRIRGRARRRVLGVYHHLQEFIETLILVKAVLLDAEQKQEQNHELREWLRQLKRVFSDAEDVLDEFECQALRKQVVKAHGTAKDKVGHFFSSSNPLVFRYRMAQQIKDISSRLEKVAADRLKFGLRTIDDDRRVVHQREMTHSHVTDSYVIGREQDKEEITQLLVHQNPKDGHKSLSIIPIVGMGGLGKTTLAKFVFNDKRIRDCFPLKMWVCVSHDFDIKQLIIKIINSANDSAFLADAPDRQQNLNILDMEQLQNQLRNKLAGQKFLLVLDDLWNEDRVKWVELRDLIQVGAAGSKILVTTRSHSIASMMGTVPSHILKGLSLEDSLSLFVNWAFNEGEEEKYPHLVNISREIVTKCGGVPLAVRTLGGLLFQKFEANEWEYVTSLWGALGLLPSPEKNRTLGDFANQFLHELLSRSFLQDYVNYGTFYVFQMHDLVHDLALFVAKDECLLINFHIQNIPKNVPHLSFAENNFLGNLFTIKSVAVRTILFLNGTAGAIGEAFLTTCVSKLKYLRVLDLSYSAFETLPRSIGKLKHLRYFNIMNNCNIKRLPDSICKLQNLQLLKLNGCLELEELPKGLRKLISLRHLEITTKQSVFPNHEIANLSSLANLCIESSHHLESIFGVEKFPALKALYVSNCRRLKSLPLDAKNFPELETLAVVHCDNLDLKLSKDHHEEQSPKLKLKYVQFWYLSQLVSLPQWLQETANSLQFLFISNCDNLEMLPEWLSTITTLKTLAIAYCPKFLSLPDNIHHLTALETLTIIGCPELCRKCQPRVGDIAESLIAKLVSPVFQEASQVLGVYHHLQEFTETLKLVKAVLLDAEQKQEQNHELREWLRQINRVFSDAEDVLDEFECRTLQKQVVKAHGTTKDKVSHFFSSSNPVVFRYRMAQQIKDISNRLDKAAADRLKFGLQIINVDTRVVHRREMTHSRVRDSDVIGREHDKEKIIELLMQQNPNDDDISLSVIPIVGIGGLGKTTLAKFVFNDKRIHECFPLKMWVCVSDDFDIKQLIIKIINSANDFASVDAPPRQQNLNMLEMEQLQNQLTNKLAGHKFLLVLDDVWNEDRVKWVEMSNLIQIGAPGSKILVTTRNYSIASMMGTVPSHVLEGLSLEDSFSLFVKWAFKEGKEENYPHLVNIGREIVAKCRGIPLAVRTLGSLLFQKFEANEWEGVRDNGIWDLPQKKDDILPALKLSYDLMPSYLRQCFALFSLYPKNYHFGSFTVTSLWWALGLLPSPEKNRTLGDVSRQYLYELQSRSFLQDFVNYGTFYIFKIHDLVHDLALFVAKDECLLINSHNQNIPENARHVSFAEKDLLGNSFTTKSVAVRTIVFTNGPAGAISEAFLNTCVSKFKYLRVLDLRNSACETLPRSIGKLINLRYFDIRDNCNLKRLPDSICKLQNLQVLRVDGCKELEALPKGLRKLISLRRLGITTKQSVLPYNEITNLSLLDTLIIDSSHNLESVFGGVKFPALRTLTVNDCQSLKSLLLDFKNFPELETLSVESSGNLDLELWKDHHEEQGPMLKLKTVHFYGLPQMVALPLWLQETANSLQSLIISNCDNLEMFPEWLSTLTNLKTLEIEECPKFLSLPDNIHHLTALERLTIEGCPELCRKCQPHVGEFWPKISYINQVLIEEPEESVEDEEEEEEEWGQEEEEEWEEDGKLRGWKAHNQGA